MRLLIVEDNRSLAEITAELLRSVDLPLQRLEAITLVADLRSAVQSLPQHDAVLCDGAFLLSADSSFIVEDWDVVWHEASRRNIHFVLYSGSARSLDAARESNIPAIAKPAAIEEIYSALTGCRLPAQTALRTGKPGVINSLYAEGASHVQTL